MFAYFMLPIPLQNLESTIISIFCVLQIDIIKYSVKKIPTRYQISNLVRLSSENCFAIEKLELGFCHVIQKVFSKSGTKSREMYVQCVSHKIAKKFLVKYHSSYASDGCFEMRNDIEIPRLHSKHVSLFR